jgi:hypothetical protein
MSSLEGEVSTDTSLYQMKEKHPSWRCLAALDQSESYETDVTEVWLDTLTGKFHVATASGCSCWDGEFDSTEYDTMEELAHSLMTEDQPNYNPSVVGAVRLIEMARDNYPKLMLDIPLHEPVKVRLAGASEADLEAARKLGVVH